MLSFRVLYSGHDLLGTNEVSTGFRLKSTENLLRALDDMSPEMEKIRDRFYAMEREWFASRGGGSWDALKASTLKYKARRGWPSDTLVRGDPANSEDLRGSLTEPGHQAGLVVISAHSLRFGTQVGYARRHDRGFTDRGGNFVAPRRPIPRRTDAAAAFGEIKAVVLASLKARMG